MKKILIFALAATALSLTGCKVEDAVRFHNLESISVSVTGGLCANTVLKVENTSGGNIRVSDASFIVTDRMGKEIGRLWVEQELVLPRRATTDILIPVKISLTDPLMGLSLMRNVDEAADNLLISGDAVLKRSGIRHKARVRNVPVSRIISTFDRKDDPSSLIRISGVS